MRGAEAPFGHPAWILPRRAKANHAGAIMNKAVIRRALIRGLVSAGLFIIQTSSFTQARSPALERDQVAQFCTSADQTIDAPRVYCGNGG